MAPKTQDTQPSALGQDEFQELLHGQLRQAVRIALVTVPEAEVDAFIGALRYQRTPQRRDRRNGHYPRDLDTTVGRIEELPVPRTRGGLKRNCLSATTADEPNWTLRSARCSCAV